MTTTLLQASDRFAQTIGRLYDGRLQGNTPNPPNTGEPAVQLVIALAHESPAFNHAPQFTAGVPIGTPAEARRVGVARHEGPDWQPREYATIVVTPGLSLREAVVQVAKNIWGLVQPIMEQQQWREAAVTCKIAYNDNSTFSWDSAETFSISLPPGSTNS